MTLQARVALLLLAFSSLACAKILKKTTLCGGKMCFYAWPELAKIPGWHQDTAASEHYEAMSLAPDGYTFNNAPVVIYAKATYKPRLPEVKSIDQYIENDLARVRSQDSTIAISEAKSFATKDGRHWKSRSFFPKHEGNWEQVVYAEETDADKNEYFLVFTISSRTQKDFEANAGAFRKMISEYSMIPKSK